MQLGHQSFVRETYHKSILIFRLAPHIPRAPAFLKRITLLAAEDLADCTFGSNIPCKGPGSKSQNKGRNGLFSYSLGENLTVNI